VTRLLLTLAMALAAHAAAAQPLGRLFYTPAERAALEDARNRNIRAEEMAAEASKRPGAAPQSRDVTVTGVILRSDGESSAWVNGKSVDGKTRDGLRVRHTSQPNRVLIYDPDKGRMVQVKVGQRADLLTGRVEENYERRKRTPAPEEALPAPSAAPAEPARAKAKPDPEPDEPAVPQ
jgi:hypothetical protein